MMQTCMQASILTFHLIIRILNCYKNPYQCVNQNYAPLVILVDPRHHSVVFQD